MSPSQHVQPHKSIALVQIHGHLATVPLRCVPHISDTAAAGGLC